MSLNDHLQVFGRLLSGPKPRAIIYDNFPSTSASMATIDIPSTTKDHTTELEQVQNAIAREARLREWNEAYADGNPLVTDDVYDQSWQAHKLDRTQIPEELFPSPTILDTVGAAPKDSGFAKVKHEVPMLSLDNIFEKDEDSVSKWFAKIEHELGFPTYISVEPKIDGVALKLTYIDDILRHAVTRGDGEFGDDVTANVLAAKLVPGILPGNATNPRRILEITGEIYIRKDTFAAMNEERRSQGLKLWKNPRNTAAGAIKLQDQVEVANRGLKFVAHGLSRVDESYEIYDSMDFIKLMRKVGIDCVDYYTVPSSAEAAVAAVADWKNKLSNPSWVVPTDGLVFKVNQWALRDKLGMSSRAPNWGVAFKFLPKQAVTRVNAIIVQVGRTGKLTPVAQLEPVLLDGSEVSNASLHNENQINLLGVRVGDEVIVHKAAEIIPEVVQSLTYQKVLEEVVKEVAEAMPDMGPNFTAQAAARQDEAARRFDERRPFFSIVAHVDGKCPCCKSDKLELRLRAGKTVGKSDANTINWFCGNPDCTAQLSARIEHFGARKTLDITNLGEALAVAIAESAHEANSEGAAVYGDPYPSTVATLLHLFTLKAEFFAELQWETERGKAKLGMGRAEQVVEGFVRAKTMPLHRWLWAIGIPSIGEGTSKEIARLFKDAADLGTLTVQNVGSQVARAVAALMAGKTTHEDVVALQINTNQLGPVSAHALMKFLESRDGKHFIASIRAFRVKSENYAPYPAAASAEKPLAGKTFVVTGTLSRKREDIHKDIEDAGGKVGGSISKKTHYLVLGENAGSKAEKAEQLGVPTISEEQLTAMIHAV